MIDLKDTQIIIRIEKKRKDFWKKIGEERNISVTNLIISSVENKIRSDERKAILNFIEKQDNIFIKIETNINQIAKTTNAQKFITPSQLTLFLGQLNEIKNLKEKQNKIFENIYALLAK